MLAQLGIQEQEKPGRSALMLDDPAAELDRENLGRLMALVRAVPAQLWVTALRPEIEELVRDGRVFHVEQGRVWRR
jgi:recombinational DNA repair ATPase RecF